MSSVPHPAKASKPEGDRLQITARRLLQLRQLRRQSFAAPMFGEPGWEILLLLYSAAAEAGLPIGKIAELIDVPPSSASRWADYLEKERLVKREPLRFDSAVVMVSLTGHGRSVLDDYLAQTLGA